MNNFYRVSLLYKLHLSFMGIFRFALLKCERQQHKSEKKNCAIVICAQSTFFNVFVSKDHLYSKRMHSCGTLDQKKRNFISVFSHFCSWLIFLNRSENNFHFHYQKTDKIFCIFAHDKNNKCQWYQNRLAQFTTNSHHFLSFNA